MNQISRRTYPPPRKREEEGKLIPLRDPLLVQLRRGMQTLRGEETEKRLEGCCSTLALPLCRCAPRLLMRLIMFRENGWQCVWSAAKKRERDWMEASSSSAAIFPSPYVRRVEQIEFFLSSNSLDSFFPKSLGSRDPTEKHRPSRLYSHPLILDLIWPHR